MVFNSLLFSASLPHNLNNPRKQRCEDNNNDQYAQILFNEFQFAEEITGIQEDRHPDKGGGYAKRDEADVSHFTHSGNERRESPDNRNEAGENNGFSSVLFVKIMRFFQITLLENFGMGIGKKFFPEEFPYEIIATIA